MIKITVDANDKRTVLRVQGRIMVEHASELRDAMLKALASSNAVTVDLSGVTDADISFMQLVCSAHKTARDAGRGFVITGSPESFWHAVNTAGFLHHRGCASTLDPCVMAAAARKEA